MTLAQGLGIVFAQGIMQAIIGPFIFHDMQWTWLNFLENAYAPWITGILDW